MQKVTVTPNIGKAVFGLQGKGVLQKKKVDPCTKCPLHPPEGHICPTFQTDLTIRTRVEALVDGKPRTDGKKPSKVLMIIVEKPEAAAFCVPGEITNLIRNCMQEASFTHVRVTAVAKCRYDKSPPKKAVEACFPRLKEEIKLVRPDVIMCVGKSAAIPFGLGGKMDDLKDVTYEIANLPYEGSRCMLLVTPNIEKILGDPLEAERFKGSFFKASRMAEADYTGKDLEYFILDTPDEFRYWSAMVPMDAIVACDIETTGLDPTAENARVRTISFAYKERHGVALVYENNPEFAKLVKAFLESGRRFVFHNGLFDVLYLRVKENIWVKEYFADTMLMLYAWQPYRSNYKLKPAAQEFTPLGAYDTEVKEGEWDTVDPVVLASYNICDSDATLRLYYLIEKWLKKNNQLDMIPLLVSHAKVIIEMHINGVMIDKEFVDATIPQIEALVDQYEQELIAILGKKYDWNSPQDLDYLLYSVLKLRRPIGVNKRYATGDAILDQLNHPVAELIRKYRKAFRIVNTYFKSYFSKTSADGRLRARYFLTITATGRTSSRDPNFRSGSSKMWLIAGNP